MRRLLDVWRDQGLQARFLLILLLVTALFTTLGGLVAFQLGYQREIDKGQTTLRDLLGAIEKTAAIAAFTADPLLLREVIEGVAANAAVAQVEILDLQGRPLMSRGAMPGRDAGAALVVEQALHSPFDAQEPLGRLRLLADMRRLRADARAQASTLTGLIVCYGLLVAGAISVLSARIVTGPIRWLSRELRTVQPGSAYRLPTRPLHRADEIGMLISSANTLLQANLAALQRERELRAEVEAMEAQYRQIFDSTSAGIFVLDEQGRLINGNPTVQKLVGLSLDEMRRLGGKDLLCTVFAQPERVLQMVHRSRERGETVSVDLELRQQGGSGRWVHCLISVQGPAGEAEADRPPDPAEGRPRGLIEGVMYDITERKRAEHLIRHQAEHDSLTGLKNRAGSLAMLDRFVQDAAARQEPVALLYIDLDGFKQVNDRLGHKAGDQVLLRCAQRLSAAVRRSSDLVGRIGGDEFVVALYNCGPDDRSLGEIALAIVESMAEPVEIDGGLQAHIGASIGIACHPLHAGSRRELLQHADEALYEVKRHGRRAFAMALPPPRG
ncbi:diguanylate cyclase domain-containing protein [Caldimonas tepidiphila]|uniref:diguanylate cyclase domain-containing protein n=1 Tax=Caldimonas tepidiphila TaxID=2315841 RepID=UPI000E5B586F|nr:diguanylate cyclase [Caldimonas tepidiphila]